MEKPSRIVDLFQEWFFKNGGILHEDACFVKPVDAEDGRYTVRVSFERPIKDDAIIVSCPTSLTFSFATCSERDLNRYTSKIDRTSLSQDVVLRLALMENYLRGPGSFWWPYISMLPQPHRLHPYLEDTTEGTASTSTKKPFNTPLYFDEEDMLWLKGTNLGAAVESKNRTWREEFDNVKEAINDVDGNRQARWTSDLYIWAATVLTTRSFSASALQIAGLDSPVLIPGIDLLNHSPSAKVTWNWGSSACSVQTNEMLNAGDEIFNNYGAKSNEELLMGYGFCLTSNQADSFNLSYAPALSQHIKAAKARYRASGGDGAGSKNQSSVTTVTEHGAGASSHDDDDATEDVKFVSIGNGDYQFSPGFLSDCSLALQNCREKKHDLVCSPLITKFSSETLSRNKLHTISSIMMVLQQKQMEIREHDKNLPPSPKNQNQKYASIYRRSQLRILERVLQGLSSTMQSIKQLNLTDLPRAVHLSDILEGIPKALKRNLREVIHAGVRTREAAKITERGAVKFSFAMWLCGLRLLRLSDDLAPYHLALSEWIDFLLRHYDHQTIEECTRDGPSDDMAASTKAQEIAATVRSYANAIRIALERHPDSLYNNEWAQDPANLTWCLVVIKEEGVRCPTVTADGILGEESDEFVVVIDAEDPK